jgi:hypothetical protein
MGRTRRTSLYGTGCRFSKKAWAIMSVLPRAQGTAKRQAYSSARWPNMTDPSGTESPSPIGPFLIWQRPHPIFYAELCYRTHRNRATLEKFKNVVFETAEFMASYATWDEATKH